MQVCTAPDKPSENWQYKIKIFLAGGITNCHNWQKEVIWYLKELESIYTSLQDVIIFNPRRDGFDDFDREEIVNQIKWEHKWLKHCNIFTVFFDSGESVQPISLFELGKWGNKKPNVITTTSNYERSFDVLVQTALDDLRCFVYDETIATKRHAEMIAQTASIFRKENR